MNKGHLSQSQRKIAVGVLITAYPLELAARYGEVGGDFLIWNI